MLTAVFATGLLFVLFVGCVLAYLDVIAEAEHHTLECEHEDLLELLWDDGDDPDWAVAARNGIRKLPERVS